MSRFWQKLVVGTGLVFGLGKSAESFQATILFTETTDTAGVGNEIYDTANSHGLGVMWIDVDKNGWPDLFAVNGFDLSPHLYMNNGDGTLALSDHLLPALPNVEMSGAVFADYDNDGDSDIYIHCNHEVLLGLSNDNPPDGPPNILLKNLFVEMGSVLPTASAVFEDVTVASGTGGETDIPYGEDYLARRTATGAFLDYDRDGFVDIYAGQWAIRHGRRVSNSNQLFRNNGDGTFADVTAAVGFPADRGNGADRRPTLACIAAHLNDDLWPDIYDVNISERMDPLPDDGTSCQTACPPRYFDFLWRNNGDNTFVDIITDSPGVGNDAAAGMGIDIADIDLDGDWDIYIADIDTTTTDDLPLGNPFYECVENEVWTDNTAVEAGIVGRFSWAVNFFDVDQDCFEDLFVGVMGTVPQDLLYHNQQDGTFVDVAASAGLVSEEFARGAAVSDYDRDGDLDFVVVERAATLRLYRNDSINLGNWLMLDLKGISSNADAIGTLVKVTAGSTTMMRQIKGGSSAHSQDDLVVHFGLDSATVADEVRIFWPSGLEEVYPDVAANQLITFKEGTSGPKQAPRPRR